MIELQELAKFVTKHKPGQADVLSPDGKASGKSYHLVAESLSQGRIQSDENAASIAGFAAGSGGYRMFKLRLREKLLNGMLFLDMDGATASKYARVAAACSRNQHCIRLLLLLNARKTAANLAIRTIKM